MAAVINWLSLCCRLDLLLRQSVGCTVHMIRCKTTTAAQKIDLVMSIKGNATSTCEVSKTAQSINGKHNRICELLWGLLRLTHNFLHFSHVHVTTPKSFFLPYVVFLKCAACVCIQYHKEGCHPHMPISMRQHGWSLYEYEQLFHTESRDWTVIYSILTLYWQ